MLRTPTHKNFFRKKASNKYLQRGQGMTEYIIIVGVIAIAAIGAFGYFGDAVEHQIAGMAHELGGKDGSGSQASAGVAAVAAKGEADRHNTLDNYHDNSSGQ